MSDELIKKSEVLSLLNKTKVALWYDNFAGAVLIAIHDAIEDMTPVNAVELPCKVGDTIYELCKLCNAIHEYEVVGFRYEYEMVFIECDLHEYTDEDIGVRVFLTREEAEKALEDLKQYEETF